MGEATRQARQDVARAREQLATEVDELELAVRSAVDIPAKLRRNPGRAAALGGGAAFLALGGPRRLARRLVGAVRPAKAAAPRSLLPDEVERVIEGLGPEAADVRATLEREFADWLASGREGGRRGRKREVRTGGAALWHLFDQVSGPIASRASRQFAERLFAADPDRPRTSADGAAAGAAGGPAAGASGGTGAARTQPAGSPAASSPTGTGRAPGDERFAGGTRPAGAGRP